MKQTLERHPQLIFSAFVLSIILLTGTLIYQYHISTSNNARAASELEAAKKTIAEKETDLATSNTNLDELRQKYALSEENGAELLRLLNEEKERNENFEDQIDDISGTVGKLDKLSKIDPELLMKYSKIYFLNEHYSPPKVAQIGTASLLKKDEPEYIHERVAPYLEDLLEEAQEDGIELRVVSGYRSFDEQKSLKSIYTVQYGSGANVFSADQGYSEHQLGTTVDFTTPEIGGGLNGFQNTQAYAWLLKNAYRYGFVLSYPENNQYYMFEPWHWRFVGEDLADDLADDGKSFYDLEQREIDSYLISIFD